MGFGVGFFLGLDGYVGVRMVGFLYLYGMSLLVQVQNELSPQLVEVK